MSERRVSADLDQSETLGSPVPEQGAARDPEEWVTGAEPMTGPQRTYLDNLARQAGEQLPADLTKAEASEHIERLQQVNARARHTGVAGAEQPNVSDASGPGSAVR